MELPKATQKLLEMLQNYSELQDSNQIMIPYKSLSDQFTIDELSLAEDALCKSKVLLSIEVKKMPFCDLLSCLKHKEEIINSPDYDDAEIDFHVYSGWTDDAIRIYKLGDTETAKFFEQESVLKIGDKRIELTPSDNEFELCKVVFKYKVNN